MSSSESQAILGALSAAEAERPDLAMLLSLYRDLFSLQFAARDRLPARPEPDPQPVRQRAQDGQPQLLFEELHLEADSFGALVDQVRAALARHKVAAREAPQGTDTDLDVIRRAQYLFACWPMLTPPDDAEADGLTGAVPPDPLRDQAIALAMVPYLQHAAEAFLPILPLMQWGRPSCPVCGGLPNLALLEAERGARRLVCSRCDWVWDYARVGCPYCRSQEAQTFFLGQSGLYRLYVCPTCNRYLKTVDLREAGRPVLPAVERLLSVHMDLAARKAGYTGRA